MSPEALENALGRFLARKATQTEEAIVDTIIELGRKKKGEIIESGDFNPEDLIKVEWGVHDHHKTYKLNCFYLEALEAVLEGLKIYRCLWCGTPVENGAGFGGNDIYCSRNCYNRFIERLKKKGQIRSGEGSRGRGKKHPKVKSYEEAYMSMREELGSRAYRKFWEKYELYIGKEPRPYKRNKTF